MENLLKNEILLLEPKVIHKYACAIMENLYLAIDNEQQIMINISINNDRAFYTFLASLF